MWSFGCILYELYVGYPLFPGEDEKDHMALMMEVKGIPPRSVLARSSRRKVFFDEDYNPIITPNSRGKIRMPGNKNLYTQMNCSDKDFVDFISVSIILLDSYKLFCILEMYRMETRIKTFTRVSFLASIYFESRKRIEMLERATPKFDISGRYPAISTVIKQRGYWKCGRQQ